MKQEIKIAKTGRITLPKELRDKYGWVKGAMMKWTVYGDEVELKITTKSI
jgi:AbrB family looped-hinge helix DNA binding protein